MLQEKEPLTCELDLHRTHNAIASLLLLVLFIYKYLYSDPSGINQCHPLTYAPTHLGNIGKLIDLRQHTAESIDIRYLQSQGHARRVLLRVG